MITSKISVLLLVLYGVVHVTSTSSSRKPSKVDLSYLHRTKSSLLAQAVQQALQQRQQEEESEEVDVDISASFIKKNVHDLLSPLLEKDTQPHRRFGIIAQQNQWTNKEATLLLKTIIGPDGIDPTTNQKSDEQQTLKSKKRRKKKEDHAVEVTEMVEPVLRNETKIAAASSDNNFTASNTNLESPVLSSEENTTLSANTSQSEDEQQASTTQQEASSYLANGIIRLDLGWNYLGGSSDTKVGRTQDKEWHQTLQRTIRSRERCPIDLRFPVCGLGPAACRAIGKGLIARFENIYNDDESNTPASLPRALCLSLVGNEAIGDPGVAALSAAIRTVASQHQDCTVLDMLDLSACGITDTGAEALAIALEHNPLCIRHLDLSNNQITNTGAAALGRALATCDGDRCSKIETLDLSNNKGIEDVGARALALALEQGAIGSLVLRSCHVHADGAAALVKSLKNLASSPRRVTEIRLDLSGNPLGILRKKPKSGGGKYSATALRSKATATTAAYMNLIGKTVQKGLKDLGIADTMGPDTLESDDEEESQMNEKDKNDDDPSKVKCGALAIADALLLDDDDDDDDDNDADDKTKVISTTSEIATSCKVYLGLRHCALDTRASEALAAVRHEMLSCSASMDMIIDVEMNNVLEEDTVAALRGDLSFEADLNEMAERYLEAMESLRMARQRSMEAAKAAKSRIHMEREKEDQWGEALPMGNGDEEEGEEWDSDADYDRDEDMEEFY